MPTCQRFRVRKLVTVLGFLLSPLFLWLALRKVKMAEVADALRSVDLVPLTLAFCAIAVGCLLMSLRWRYLVSQSQPVRWGDVFSAMMVGYFANNVLPARTGELLRAHVLGRRANLSRAFTLATIIIERLSDVVSLLLVLTVIMVGFPLPLWARRIGLVVFLLLLVVLLVLVEVADGRRSSKFLLRFALMQKIAERVRYPLMSFREGLQTLVGVKRLSVLLGLSLLIWSLSALTLSLTLASLGLSVPVYGLFFTTAIINLGMVIPSSPGYIGTYQWLVMSALGVFQISHSRALTCSIVLHALWYIPLTVVGAICFWRENLHLSRALGYAESAPSALDTVPK
ncbi:MAG: flippase-like domain-containing protein [Abditibacteriales bacterium]|nr:flippase-like domain-containing protein [Abditibacteriales bacterium]